MATRWSHHPGKRQILLFIAGIGSLHTDGITTAESFTTTPDAVTGQELYVEKFDPGAVFLPSSPRTSAAQMQ